MNQKNLNVEGTERMCRDHIENVHKENMADLENTYQLKRQKENHEQQIKCGELLLRFKAQTEKDKRSLKVFNVNDCLSKNTCMCLERSMEDEKMLGNYFFNRKHSIDASSYYKDPEKNKEIYPLSIAHDLKSSHLMIVNSLGNVIYLNHDLNRKKLTEEKYIKLKFWRDDKRKMTV